MVTGMAFFQMLSIPEKVTLKKIVNTILNRKDKAPVFLTAFTAKSTLGFARSYLKTESLPHTF